MSNASPTRLRRVLFLCTGNSARSITAEALLNVWGRGRYRAFSAGSHPKGRVHPFALDLLMRAGLPIGDLRSKSWEEFARPEAPELDFVITVCDSAAGEVCPLWPGQPITAHWSFRDPAAATGNEAEIRAIFAETFREIETRIKIFCALPLAGLDRLAAQREMARIGDSLPAGRKA